MTHQRYFDAASLSPQLRLYHRRKAEGLCVACGKLPHVAKNLRCASCKKDRRKLSAEQKNNRRKGFCRQCLTKPATKNRSTCTVCSEQNRLTSQIGNRKAKLDLVARYGGKCNCCGLAVVKYLQLHHIDGGGSKERAALPSHIRGTNFYKHVLKQPVRTDLEWLCGSCHEAKRHGGCTNDDHMAMRGALTIDR